MGRVNTTERTVNLSVRTWTFHLSGILEKPVQGFEQRSDIALFDCVLTLYFAENIF